MRFSRVLRIGLAISLCLSFVLTSGCRTWSTREQSAVEAFNSGNEFRKRGRIEEAVAAYRKAIEYQEDFAAAVYNLGLSLGELERWDEGIELLESLHARDPQNLMILRALGGMSRQSGDTDMALAYYRSALNLFEADEESLRALAGIQEELGNPELALEYWRTLLYLNNNVESLEAMNFVYHSLMFVRSGVVAAECYRFPFTKDTTHCMYSVSKNITATALGFAISEGKISLDSKLSDIFPDKYPKKRDEYFEDITIRNLVSMTAGKSPSYLLNKSKGDWYRHFSEAARKAKPGEKFEYVNECTFVWNACLKRVLGMGINDYHVPRLWSEIGMD